MRTRLGVGSCSQVTEKLKIQPIAVLSDTPPFKITMKHEAVCIHLLCNAESTAGFQVCTVTAQGHKLSAYTTSFGKFFAWFSEGQDWVCQAFTETCVHQANYTVTIKQATAFAHIYETCTKQTGSANHTKSSPKEAIKSIGIEQLQWGKLSSKWPWSVSTELESIFVGFKYYSQILYWFITQRVLLTPIQLY